MGVNIEFDRVAVEYNNTEDTSSRERYLLLHEMGSDNSFDRDGNIARAWQYYAVGTFPEVMANLASVTGDIERGMMRYSNSRNLKIENYLRNWRETIENDALSVSEFNFRFPNAQLEVSNIEDPDREDSDLWRTISTVVDSWDVKHTENGDEPTYCSAMTEEALSQFEQLRDSSHVHVHL